MGSFQALVTGFRTNILGHLTADEIEAVQHAQSTLQDGWLAYEKSVTHPISGKIVTLMAELASDNPKRQRAALASPDLKLFLATEEQRNKNLSEMYYFRQL